MMELVWDRLERLAQSLHNRQLLLSVDFDGTLIERSRTPRRVAVPHAIQRSLAVLARRTDSAVLINSGRDIEELRRLLPVAGLGFAGNHGLEIQMDELRARYRNPQWRATLDSVMEPLTALAREYPDLMVHDKGLTLAVYTGAVPVEHRPAVEAACRALVAHLLGGRVTPGVDNMLNVRPAIALNKATALQEVLEWLQTRRPAPRFFAIHLGDDASDEEVFSALEPRQGCGIQVGDSGLPAGSAAYFLRDTAEVDQFLQWLCER